MAHKQRGFTANKPADIPLLGWCRFLCITGYCTERQKRKHSSKTNE
ncbi:MAG: hypothetical protein ACTH4U_02550 [Pseudoalteromonas prydzensis]